MKPTVAALLFVGLCLAPPQVAADEAKATDVESIDAILGALYDVISGPSGKQVDWERLRSLFIAEGHIIGDPTGGTSPVVWSIEAYIETFDPILTSADFWEWEIARRTDHFRGVAHVFSTYEGRRTKDSPEPDVRGVNSIQLIDDGSRWWIVSIVFQGATDEQPLPKKYLPSGE